MQLGDTLIGTIIGGVVTIIITKLLKRRSTFIVERYDEEFSQSKNLPIGANLRVMHGQREIENFRISRFNIKNESSKDFENVKVRIWSGPDRFILHDTVRMVNYIDRIPYHPEYLSSLQPDENGEYSQLQISEYNTKREYLFGTFNRFDKAEITVVSSVEGQAKTNVWIEIPHKGIKISNKYQRTFFMGAPNDEVFPYTIFFIIASIIIPALLFKNPWIIAGAVGLFSFISGYLGPIAYRIKKWIYLKLVD